MNIFGGYTKIECTSNIKYDNTTFVFVLESNDSKQNAEIFPFLDEQENSYWPQWRYCGGQGETWTLSRFYAEHLILLAKM